ncbi:unnamed protein product [Caenorhabditis brenneri]
MIANHFQVDITDRFQVYLSATNYSPLTFRLYQVLENKNSRNSRTQELGTPGDVRVLHERKWITWTNSMSVKELLNHLQFVFHSSGAFLFFKENNERFSLESVHENVKDIRNIGFLSGKHEQNRRILSLFQPAHITLFAQALVNLRVPRYILIQNFDVVHVFAVQTTLDDLLMTNFRFIDLRARVSTKSLNQFLKLWTKGSNSRLECLFLEFHGNLLIEELLSGLKYQNAPEGVRRFKSFDVRRPVGIPNGRDIWRFDGTKATILVEIKSYFSITLFSQNYESVCFELCHLHANGPLQELETPGNILIRSEHPQRWTTSLSVGQLLDNLKRVFHSPITILKFSANFERFNLELLHKNVKDIREISLATRNHEYNRRILSVLKPASLTVEGEALVNGFLPMNVLVQNFDVIRVSTVQRITLDKLLLMNSREIDMFCRRLSAKTLNKFLKLWAYGSNPRLEFMCLGFNRDGFRNRELMSELWYEDAPRNTERVFKAPGSKEPKKVTGGWDIWRFDGTQATITVQGTGGFVNFSIFGISLLSKRTKNLVEPLKVTAKYFPVVVTNSFHICLYFSNHPPLFFKLYQVQYNEPLQELGTPKNLIIQCEDKSVTWANFMSVKELLDHFQCIFHASISTLCFGLCCGRFSFESIHKTVRNFRSICFPTGNHGQNRRILKLFRPAGLDLLEDALDDGHIPRYLSIQNFDFICVPDVQINLGDLLVVNARSITLTCDVLSIKTPNRFLKLWAKGSNPRLEYMFLPFRCPEFQKEELLKGLKYQDVPLNRKRFFKVCGKKKPKEVIGGCDIWRLDGRTATVTFERNGDFVELQLFVWHDHCIVN